jgi:hypothetical protein
METSTMWRGWIGVDWGGLIFPNAKGKDAMKRACLLASLLVILLSVGCGKKGAGLSGTDKGKHDVPAADVCCQD